MATRSEDLVSEIEEISDTSEGYFASYLVDRKAIAKQDFDLEEKDNFLKKGFSLKECFSRKNILYFGMILGEQFIDSEDTEGDVELSIISEKQIIEKIRRLKEGRSLQTIHISTIQFILKSTYVLGIDSPITLEILDRRFTDPKKQILAQGNCNLSLGKVKFDLRLMIGMSLKDRSLNQSITLRYKANKIFKNGDHPFSISYRVNYALSNSHHSIEFKDTERIHVNELFSPLVELAPQDNNLVRIKTKEDRLIRNNSLKAIDTLERYRSRRITEPLPEIRNYKNQDDSIQELKDLVSKMNEKL